MEMEEEGERWRWRGLWKKERGTMKEEREIERNDEGKRVDRGRREWITGKIEVGEIGRLSRQR